MCRAVETVRFRTAWLRPIDCRLSGETEGSPHADAGLSGDARSRPCMYSHIPPCEGTIKAAAPGQARSADQTARAERAKQVGGDSRCSHRKQFCRLVSTLYALLEHPTGGLWRRTDSHGFPVYIEIRRRKINPSP